MNKLVEISLFKVEFEDLAAPPTMSLPTGELLKFYVVLSASKQTVYQPVSTSLFEQLSFDTHFCVDEPVRCWPDVVCLFL
jgi:hypothetical protein